MALKEQKGRRGNLDSLYVTRTRSHSCTNWNVTSCVTVMFFQAEEVKELVTQEVAEKCGKIYYSFPVRIFTTARPPQKKKKRINICF